jgi:hypothetical protein
VSPSVGEVGVDEVPRLDRSVRQPEHSPDLRVEGWLAAKRFRDRDLLALDIGSGTRCREGVDVVFGVVRRGDEEAARRFDAGRRDPAQNAVLDDALSRRNGVLGRIAAAGVEEPVVPAGCAGTEVTAINEQAAQAAPREVPQDPGSGSAPADDEHVVGVRLSHAEYLDPPISEPLGMRLRLAA